MNIKNIKLPTNGLIKDVPEEVQVRAMKGSEVSAVYSNFNDEVIDKIIKQVTTTIDGEAINVNSLTDEDKHIILHATRVQTFGNTTIQTVQCPYCSKVQEHEVNYDLFETKFLEQEYIDNPNITTKNNNIFERKVPTSEDYKHIRNFRDKHNVSKDDDFILVQMAKIDKVNGEKLTNIRLLDLLKDLPGDELLELSRELEVDFGYKTTFNVDCEECRRAITGVLGLGQNLFR